MDAKMGDKKGPKVRSEIWNHFTKILGGERAKCNYCGSTFKAVSSIGTSTKIDFSKKDEVQRYLQEPTEDVSDGNFDILNWWKVNKSRFEYLSEVARDVLAIPVSTVSSESAFSTGGRILDPFRSSLTPQTVEALICTQNWLREESRLLKVCQDRICIEETEFYEGIETDSLGESTEHAGIASLLTMFSENRNDFGTTSQNGEHS